MTIQSYLNHPVNAFRIITDPEKQKRRTKKIRETIFLQPPTEISPYPTPQSCTLARTFTENRSRAKSVFFQPPSPSALGVAGLSLSVDQSTELFEIDGTILTHIRFSKGFEFGRRPCILQDFGEGTQGDFAFSAHVEAMEGRK